MRAQSAKKAAGNAKRRRAETDLGRDEDGNGCCWRCGQWGEVHGHERLAQAHGGDRTNPDAILCNPCNDDYCEGDPVDAAWTGWKISSKHARDPRLEPWQAFNTRGEIVSFLTDDDWVQGTWQGSLL